MWKRWRRRPAPDPAGSEHERLDRRVAGAVVPVQGQRASAVPAGDADDAIGFEARPRTERSPQIHGSRLASNRINGFGANFELLSEPPAAMSIEELLQERGGLPQRAHRALD